jgi:hypothetical protein
MRQYALDKRTNPKPAVYYTYSILEGSKSERCTHTMAVHANIDRFTDI